MILFRQQIKASFPSVGWQKDLAAGSDQQPPAFNHLRQVLPERRKDRTGKYSEKGVSHNGNIVLNDYTHRTLGMARGVKDTAVYPERCEVKFIGHKDIGCYGPVMKFLLHAPRKEAGKESGRRSGSGHDRIFSSFQQLRFALVNNDPKPKMFFQGSSIFGMIEMGMGEDKTTNGFYAWFRIRFSNDFNWYRRPVSTIAARFPSIRFYE